MTPDFRQDAYGERMRGNLGSPDGADYEHEAARTERRWLRSIGGGALLIVALVLIAAGLPGCTTVVDGICAVKPLGENEDGVTFIRYHCEPTK